MCTTNGSVIKNQERRRSCLKLSFYWIMIFYNQEVRFCQFYATLPKSIVTETRSAMGHQRVVLDTGEATYRHTTKKLKINSIRKKMNYAPPKLKSNPDVLILFWFFPLPDNDKIMQAGHTRVSYKEIINPLNRAPYRRVLLIKNSIFTPLTWSNFSRIRHTYRGRKH